MIEWQVNYDDEQKRTNIHALQRIATHGLSVQAIKAYASDCTATETGHTLFNAFFIFRTMAFMVDTTTPRAREMYSNSHSLVQP
jgi:hypothetical protein